MQPASDLTETPQVEQTLVFMPVLMLISCRLSSSIQ
jgi:hypothetical protein